MELWIFFGEKFTCKNPQFSPPEAAEKNPHVEKHPENFERKSSIHARWVKNDEKNCFEMKEYEKIACGALEANFSVENTFLILFTVDFYKFAAKRRKKSTSKNPQFWPPNAAEKNPQFCQTFKKTLVWDTGWCITLYLKIIFMIICHWWWWFRWHGWWNGAIRFHECGFGLRSYSHCSLKLTIIIVDMEPKFFILGVSIIIVNVNKGELQTCIFLKIFLRAPRAPQKKPVSL